jgi:DNA replication protein DnaC
MVKMDGVKEIPPADGGHQEIAGALTTCHSQEAWYLEVAEKLDGFREHLVDTYKEGEVGLERCTSMWEEKLWAARAAHAKGRLRLPGEIKNFPHKLRNQTRETHDAIVAQFLDGRLAWKEAEEKHKEAVKLVETEWVSDWVLSNVPYEYVRQIDFEKLPNKRAFDEVMQYVDSFDEWLEQGRKDGIVAFGKTGTGKTRSIYRAIIRSVERGSSLCSDFKIISAPDLASMVRTMAIGNVKQLESELGELAYTEMLFIDDLHQAKFTPRYAEELMRIIEKRYSMVSGTLITCQVPGEALVRKLAGDNPQLREVAEAIVRRIRDMCEPIDFDAK